MTSFPTAAHVLADVTRVGEHLRRYGCTRAADGQLVGKTCATFTVRLAPYPELEAHGYVEEVLRIAVWRDGTILAIPTPDDRAWRHRNRTVFRELCLWYERDPQALQWRWGDDLLEFLAIAHRHLIAEEYCRRHGHWPAEDAPHGHPDGGGSHPIRSARLRLLST